MLLFMCKHYGLKKKFLLHGTEIKELVRFVRLLTLSQSFRFQCYKSKIWEDLCIPTFYLLMVHGSLVSTPLNSLLTSVSFPKNRQATVDT